MPIAQDSCLYRECKIAVQNGMSVENRSIEKEICSQIFQGVEKCILLFCCNWSGNMIMSKKGCCGDKTDTHQRTNNNKQSSQAKPRNKKTSRNKAHKRKTTLQMTTIKYAG